MNQLKKQLQNGEIVHGCWLNMGSNVSAEIVSHAGFDWVLVDLEHGIGTEANIFSQLQGIGDNGAVPLVRVESNEGARVKRVLDVGFKGIMFPQIQNADEARKGIDNMYYPPVGKRGFAKMTRATQFGKGFDEYYEFAKSGLLGIIQIETLESLNHLDEIAAIEGVDVLFLGPADMSLALGVFGQWDHPLFVNAVKAIGDAAQKAGKAAGVLFFDLNEYQFYFNHGYRFLASGSDMTFLNSGATRMAQDLNELRKKHN